MIDCVSLSRQNRALFQNVTKAFHIHRFYTNSNRRNFVKNTNSLLVYLALQTYKWIDYWLALCLHRALATCDSRLSNSLGRRHYLWPPGVAPKRNVFLVTKLLIQFQKNYRTWTSNINSKINNPRPKTYKRIPFSCHTCPLPLLWHEFDNCLYNFLQSKVSCCLHVYFLWRQHSLTDKLENDQNTVTLIDLHIVLTSNCQFLVFNIWAKWKCGNMTIHFYYPTLELFCSPLIQPFTHSEFCLPNLFSSVLTPRHK